MSAQEIKTNIQRLKKTIAQNFWNKGYVANCKNAIATYNTMLTKLA